MKKEKKVLSLEEKKTKKKKIIKTSIILGCISLLAIPLGLWFGYMNNDLSKPINPDKFLSSWMSYIKEDTRLNELVIPGAHDAGTNKMMPQARTQGHDFKDQLRGGVRYFDTRVTSKGDDLVIFHGPIKGQSFLNVLKDVKEFINTNPSEFIVLDLQHIEDKAKDKIVKTIKSYIDEDKILDPRYNSFYDLTLKDIHKQKVNVALLFKGLEKEERKYNYDNKLFTRESALYSPYERQIHKKSDEDLINYFKTYTLNNTHSRLFVLQAQRTAKTLLGRPELYENRFDPKVNNYILNLKNRNELLYKTNIIMRDFVVSKDYKVKNILKLNINKNLVKDDYKDFFMEKVS